jgi:nucleoside-diphosphate-sugar epimerase
MKRILVTGGAGFLDSHLCERLLAQHIADLAALARLGNKLQPAAMPAAPTEQPTGSLAQTA